MKQLLLAGLVLAGLPLGCGAERQTAPGELASGSPTTGGECRVGISSDVGSFFEWFARRAHELEVIGLVFQPLATLDAGSGEFRPALASSWSFREEGAVLEFRIRDGARWSDGTRVTARDVVFTHGLQTSEEIGWYARGDKAAITEVEAVDEQTVRYRFARAYADSLHDAARGRIYPAHLLEDVPLARLASHPFANEPVGCGPFRVGRRKPGEALELVANETYHAGRPWLDRLVFRVIADKESRALMLEDGEIDLLRLATSEQFERLSASEQFRGYLARSPRYMTLIWNTTDPLLADARVRGALAAAIDRERMVELVQRGRGEICPGPIAPGSWAFAAELPRTAHDPDRAARMLDAAGWILRDGERTRSRNGMPLAFELGVVSGNRLYADTAELIRADLERVGVEVRVRPREGGVFFDELYSGTGQASLITETAESKVDLTSLAHSGSIEDGSNYARYANPAFDDVCERARRASDREQARPLWRRAEEILIEDQPYTCLFYRPGTHVLHARFRDVRIDRNGLFANAHEWWVAPGERRP